MNKTVLKKLLGLSLIATTSVATMGCSTTTSVKAQPNQEGTSQEAETRNTRYPRRNH